MHMRFISSMTTKVQMHKDSIQHVPLSRKYVLGKLD